MGPTPSVARTASSCTRSDVTHAGEESGWGPPVGVHPEMPPNRTLAAGLTVVRAAALARPPPTTGPPPVVGWRVVLGPQAVTARTAQTSPAPRGPAIRPDSVETRAIVPYRHNEAKLASQLRPAPAVRDPTRTKSAGYK